MSPDHDFSDGNSLLISLATTVAAGYLATRFRVFRGLWRYLPLLVVVSAWLLNRQVAEAAQPADATMGS